MIVGDVVRLKSGGPWMTVCAVLVDSKYECTWFPVTAIAQTIDVEGVEIFASMPVKTTVIGDALEQRPVEEPTPEVASGARTDPGAR